LGRTVPSLKMAELLFANGDMCLVDMPLKDGVAAGLVLSNSKDTIVNCFGFRETFVRNDCIMWKKLNNGTWEEPKEIDFEESTRIVLDRLFAEDQQYFHYPTYTYCQEARDCVYLWLANFIYKMMLKDDGTIVMNEIHENNAKDNNVKGINWSIRGCMVKIDNYLVRLGGAEDSFDHLNVGPALDYIKTNKLNKAEDGLLMEWQNPICPVSYRGYMQQCFAIESPWQNDIKIILSIGGEYSNDKDDEIPTDIADMRIISFQGVGNKAKFGNEQGIFGPCGDKNFSIPDGSNKGVLINAKKDFSWGWMEFSNGSRVLAMAIGGRSKAGRKNSTALGDVMLVDYRPYFYNQFEELNSDTIRRTKLLTPRYGINAISVPTNLFKKN